MYIYCQLATCQLACFVLKGTLLLCTVGTRFSPEFFYSGISWVQHAKYRGMQLQHWA